MLTGINIPWELLEDKTKHPFIYNRASTEAATGPGILEQNTERRKGANAPGGYGG